MRSATVNKTWCYQVNFDLRCSWWGSYFCVVRINWIDVTEEFTWTNTTASSFTRNILVWWGQVVEFYLRQTWWTVAYIDDVEFNYKEVNNVPSGTI